jgi:anti-sigma-K factor RskA
MKEYQHVGGDIVWSDSEQTGYMRFRNLPVNDKSKETYQLWIFDETQEEKTPIDGGTFDVDQNGEVVIPINARLKAKNPKAFAVTVEKPGGVVVSKRERIAAIGKTSA